MICADLCKDIYQAVMIIPSQHTDGHGEDATPDDESRHARFPHLNPLPEGEEANESLREFHVNQDVRMILIGRSIASRIFTSGTLNENP